jgi:hypothetical protein
MFRKERGELCVGGTRWQKGRFDVVEKVIDVLDQVLHFLEWVNFPKSLCEVS